VQACPSASPFNWRVVTTTLLAGGVQWLVDVSQKVDKESQSVLTAGLLLRSGWFNDLVLLKLGCHVENTIDDVLSTIHVLEFACIWWIVSWCVDVMNNRCPS
jgi:hypothetical protein